MMFPLATWRTSNAVQSRSYTLKTGMLTGNTKADFHTTETDCTKGTRQHPKHFCVQPSGSHPLWLKFEGLSPHTTERATSEASSGKSSQVGINGFQRISFQETLLDSLHALEPPNLKPSHFHKLAGICRQYSMPGLQHSVHSIDVAQEFPYAIGTAKQQVVLLKIQQL